MAEQLKLLIQSGNPLIAIETSDEQRVLDLVQKVSEKITRPVFHWSMTEGLTKRPQFENESESLRNPEMILRSATALDVLKVLLKDPEKGIYVFKDLGPHCKDAHVHRLMRDLLGICEKNKMTLILVDSTSLPDEIGRFTVRFEIGWPDVEELEQVVRETYQRIKQESYVKINSNLKRKEMDQLVQSLRGLSCAEASRVIASAIYDDYILNSSDLPKIIEGKRQLLSNAGCLESIAADFSSEDIGGLANLKAWLKQRRGGFSPQSKRIRPGTTSRSSDAGSAWLR